MRFITPPFEDRVSLHAKSLTKSTYNYMADKALLAKENLLWKMDWTSI
jgi:hypothetical protein